MKAMRRLRDIGIAAAILALLALVVLRIGDPGGETIAGAARAADGDTLTLGGYRIRLIGIDAPEMAQACRRDGAAWTCGTAARARLAELLKRGVVECRASGTDRYGRTLARCLSGEDDVGAVLVREGLAVAYGGYEHEEAWRRRSGAGSGAPSSIVRRIGAGRMDDRRKKPIWQGRACLPMSGGGSDSTERRLFWMEP